MENKPFFSIVIPAYNCAGTILATLESIAAQTISDFEVIIVNDGSKDATADVLQGFANMDSRFSFITIPNNGPGNARNQGIARAQGRYLFLMDADDEIEQHTLDEFVEVRGWKALGNRVSALKIKEIKQLESIQAEIAEPEIVENEPDIAAPSDEDETPPQTPPAAPDETGQLGLF